MWGFVASLASWIFHGLTVAAEFSISWIIPTVRFLYNGAVATGKLIGKFGRRVWGVFRATWDHVLRPAWEKFDRFVTRVHDWLEKHFGPLLGKINAIRKRLGDWWKRYVRPILDLLDVARAFLRVLAQLGIDWARKLDEELARLQSLIAKPFLEVFRRLNEVADWINRIVTLDGLFQRVTLLKSLMRDAKHTANIWWNTVHRTSTADEAAAAKEKLKRKSAEVHTAELREAVRDKSGPLANRIAEETADFKKILAAVRQQ